MFPSRFLTFLSPSGKLYKGIQRDTRQKVCFLISIKVRKVFPKDKILPSGKTNVPFQEGGSAILTDRTEVIDKNLFIQNTSSSIKERKIRPVRIEKPFFCPQIFFRLSFRFRAIKCFTCFQQPEEYSNQSSIRFVQLHTVFSPPLLLQFFARVLK